MFIFYDFFWVWFGLVWFENNMIFVLSLEILWNVEYCTRNLRQIING